MKQKKHIKFAALDAVLIVLILSSLAAVCVRIFIGEEGFFPEDAKTEGTYAVVLVPDDENSDKLMEEMKIGDEVYLTSGEILGKVASATSKSTQAHVSGIMTDSGFLMNGTFYLAPNMKLELSLEEETAHVTVTDITFLN